MNFNDTHLTRWNYFNYFLVIVFIGSVLFPLIGIQGFLHGHEGWAGPDLYSPAINLDISKGFLARTIDENHNVMLDYHHHPLLGFYIYNLVAKISPDSYMWRLRFGYLFATVILIIGWLIFYFFLKRLSYKRSVCLFATALLACSIYYAHNKALTNFDSLTCITCSILLFAYHTLFNQTKIKYNFNIKIILSWIIILISLNISLYFYAVNFVFACIYIYEGFKNKYGIQTILLSIILPFFIICLFSISTIVVGIYLRGDFNNLIDIIIADAGSIESVSPDRKLAFTTLIIRLFYRFSENFNKYNICIIALIIYTKILIKESINKSYLKNLLVASPFIFGGLIFILLTRYWSVIHPFAFQIIAIGVIIIVANIATSHDTRIKFLVITSTSIILLYGIYQNYKIGKEDCDESVNTTALIKVVDDNFKKVSFNFLNTHSCGAFNPGMLWFISSYPNYTFNDKLEIGSKIIKVECIDPQNSTLKFYNYSKTKSYYVIYGKKDYIVKDGQ